MPDRDELLEELVEGAPDAIIVVDSVGNLGLVNRQTEVLFGYGREQLLGEPVELLVPEWHSARRHRPRSRHPAAPSVQLTGDGDPLLGRRSDGSEFPVEISLAPLSFRGVHAFTAVVRDATERAELEAELVRLALHDPMTGLPNRTLVMDRLHSSLARNKRKDAATAVLFVDIDHLKWINDNLGHEAGDTLIVALGERMSGALRPSDTVARVGGDEFLVIIEDVAGPAEAIALTGRLVAAARLPITVAAHQLNPTVSVGIAVSTPSIDMGQLLQEADDAMYHAKKHGRDRAELFREEWRADVRRALELTEALTRDIDRGELDVHYQPIIELRSGRVWGVEALLRWRGPQGELVRAREVVRVAEQSRLVPALDRLVMRKACTFLAGLPASHGLRVGVNISVRHLATGDLAGVVAECLADTAIPANALWLELTEGEYLVHDDARRALGELRALGVHIAIDDFGSGFSSLSRLRDLPVDLLKIDSGFTRGIDSDRRGQAQVAAVVDLGHALGLDVLAEGVEGEKQLSALSVLGCDLGQGEYWTPALDEDHLRSWLRNHTP